MTSRQGHWHPILSDDQRHRAAFAIEAIAQTLTDAKADRDDLARGIAGAALFFAYRDRTRDLAGSDPELARMLRAALDTSFPEPRRPMFMHGQTGTVWVARHLQSHVDADELERITREVEDLLLARLAMQPMTEGFELFQGIVGYARFGLDALERPKGRQIAEHAITRLAELADPEHDGVRWWTVPPKRPEGRHIRLGLAHGVPGPIVVLAEACHAGISTDMARPLLDRAVRWLLAQRNPEGVATSLFGTLISSQDEGIDRRQSRLAWCWGDLGIGAALHAAAIRVGDASWADAAIEIARHAARRSMDDAGVITAGLCHGAAGAGHIFNRLYQSTRDPVFLTAAQQWFERTLEYAALEAPPATSEPPDPSIVHPWPTVPGLMSGLSGIGLALLAASTDIEPEWDGALLISMRPRPEKDALAYTTQDAHVRVS
jgi:lantibiotic biosynthesis protein